jgi:hypothetical protein
LGWGLFNFIGHWVIGHFQSTNKRNYLIIKYLVKKKLEIRNSELEIRNSELEIRNSELEIRNSELETRN